MFALSAPPPSKENNNNNNNKTAKKLEAKFIDLSVLTVDHTVD